MIISSLILLIFLSMTLLYSKNIVQSHRYLQSRTIPSKSRARNRVILLVPLFQETAIIAQTIDYFAGLAYSLETPVIFITTGREGDTTRNQTYQAAQKLLAGRPLISLRHYAKAHGSKATQLNWAIEQYGYQTDYFGVFDADSKPDFRGIQYVQQASDRPAVFQMPSIYSPHASNSLASQALAAFQTRWSYCFEIPKWRAWQQQPARSHAMYLVGHGLFLRSDLRFSENTISEDLELGYRLSAQASSLELIPFFDRAYAPQKFAAAIIQASRWYYGELLAPLTFQRHIKESKHVVGYVRRCVIRYAQILLWMLGPILVVGSLVATISKLLLFMLGIITAGLYCAQSGFICRYGHAPYSSLILMPIRVAINGVGPLLCVGYVLLDKLHIREFQFVKTKR